MKENCYAKDILYSSHIKKWKIANCNAIPGKLFPGHYFFVRSQIWENLLSTISLLPVCLWVYPVILVVSLCQEDIAKFLVHWHLVIITRTFGPWNLPCYIYLGSISSSVLSVFFTDKFALSQSDARISVAYNSCQWLTRFMKCCPGFLLYQGKKQRNIKRWVK